MALSGAAIVVKQRSEARDYNSRNNGVQIPDPPHSVEAEKGVLSSIMIKPDFALPRCSEKAISERHFFVPAHRIMYSTLSAQRESGQPIDLITFTQALRDKNVLKTVGDAAAVTEIFTFVPTAANIDYYLDIICEKKAERDSEATIELYRKREIELPQLAEQLRELADAGTDFPKIVDAAVLISAPIELPPDIVEGVAHAGAKIVLGGTSKSFKTWLLCDLAIAVATGTDWLGFHARRGRALFINLEIQPPFFAQRIQTICQAKNVQLEPDWLRVLNLRGHAADSATLLPRLLPLIGRDQYALDVIDPVYKLLGGRDENKAGDIATLLNDLERLTVKTGAAVAFGSHYSKGNQAAKESIDRIGGSGVFARDPDSILNFTRHEEKDCFTVEMTLRNHPPVDPFVVRWNFPLMQRDESLDPAQLKKPAGRPPKFSTAQVLEHVSWTDGAYVSDICKHVMKVTGMSRRTFFDRWNELKAEGKISAANDLWTRC
jgi:hypothetical protein